MNLSSDNISRFSISLMLFLFGILWSSVSCVIFFQPRLIYIVHVIYSDYIFAICSFIVSYLLFYNSYILLLDKNLKSDR